MNNIHILSKDKMFCEAMKSLLMEENETSRCICYPKAEKMILEFQRFDSKNIIIDTDGFTYGMILNTVRLLKRDSPHASIFTVLNSSIANRKNYTMGLFLYSDYMINKFDRLSHVREAIKCYLFFSNTDKSQMNREDRIDSERKTHYSKRLTKREIDILSHLIAGKGAKEIATELSISAKTVYSHKHKLYEKLGVKNIVELYEIMNISSML
ncbi:LuxR C-terminal-related transcriptional regulator [Edaphovirga cremea]|uniref:response regulator transcription factor n=1 Tax=Edaphovirga cremea TaxID=2267246 RepID=UPI00398996E4